MASPLYRPLKSTSDLSILQPDLRPVIAAFGDSPPSQIAETPEVAVRFFRSIPPKKYEHPEVEIRDIYVSTKDALPSQPPTAVRVYVPRRENCEEGLPVVMWSHHGGFFSQGPMALDLFCCSIVAEAQVVVVAPAYRQTPENPFPAPFDDVYQVLRWLFSSPEALRYSIDPSRVAIGGTSSGATVSVGVYLKFRDEGYDVSRIRLLILEDGSYANDSTSYSTSHNPINQLWNANITRYMWQMYLPQGVEGLDARSKGYAVPALVTDEELKKGFPRTMVLCAQWDDLTNDAVEFAHRLLECGVNTELHIYRGTFHISDKLVHDAKSSRKKREDIVDALRDAFGSSDS